MNAKKIRRLPGTIIKQTLASYGITEHTGCGCAALCAEMDLLGNDELERRLDEYVVKLVDSAKQWKKTGNWVERNIVPIPNEEEARLFITWAIKKSREEFAS